MTWSTEIAQIDMHDIAQVKKFPKEAEENGWEIINIETVSYPEGARYRIWYKTIAYTKDK